VRNGPPCVCVPIAQVSRLLESQAVERAMVDGPPNDPKVAAETIRRFWNRFLPAEDRYRRIIIALIVCFAVVFLPFYLAAPANETMFKIVYWMWRFTIFGMWSDTSPYQCYNLGGVGSMCPGVGLRGQPHFGYALVFFLGGIVSLRLVVLCLEYLERATGVDIISRLLDRILPGATKKPD